MNKDIRQRVVELFSKYKTATLATCGEAGVQVSSVNYQTQQLTVYLLLPSYSDHLFNLETQPELVLLSPAWKLYGRKLEEVKSMILATQMWQTTIAVQPLRLHVNDENRNHIVETIDF